MIRFAFIVEDITRFGGTERAVANLIPLFKNDQKYSMRIISIYSNEGDTVPFIEPENSRDSIIHLGINVSSKIERIKLYMMLPNLFKQIAIENQFDILFGTTHAINSLLSVVNDIKVVGCEHRIYEACPRISSIVRYFAYKKLDAVVVLTKADSTKYTFIKSDKLFVIPNVISFVVDKPSRLQHKQIIAVGRLDKNKGYDGLIRAISIIKEELIDGWHVTIFGEGEEKENLLKQIREANLEKIVSINRPVLDIKKEYLSSDILVMTSHNEGLPMALIEGQTCGLPIISYDCPNGPNEIIEDSVNGYLIPVDNEKLLGDRIATLISNENLRILFGSNAYKSSKRFSGENIKIKWIIMINQIVKGTTR